MSDLLTKKLNGFHLIDASAGTGKTYTITALVVRLLLEKGYSLAEILIVTYTEAAAGDLRKRVREILVQMRHGYDWCDMDDPFIRAMVLREDIDPLVCKKRVQLALKEFDGAAIFTIHSFCQRTLKENGLESGMGFDMELEEDMSPHEYQVASDYWRKISVHFSPGFLSHCGGTFYPKNSSHYFRNMRPELEIIPDTPHQNLGQIEQQYADSYRRVAGMWQKHGREVHDIFARQTSLNGTKYRKASVPKWLEVLDDYFTGSLASPPPAPKWLEKFTTTSLNAGLKKNGAPLDHSFFDLAESLWEYWTTVVQSYKGQLLHLQKQFYDFARDELNRVKEDGRILSFDDLLIRVQQGLVGSGGESLAASLRHQYPAILIDEFQDTDPVQFKIFNGIHGGDSEHLLYLIGDPKQAIYNFRGADIFAYLKAAETVQNRETLPYNYRSEEGLIDGVNHIFSGANPFLIDGISFEKAQFPGRSRDTLRVVGDDSAHIHILFGERPDPPEGKRPKGMVVAESRRQVAMGCCAEITRLLHLADQHKATIGGKPVQPQDIAILVRENKDARYLQNMLREYGVASVVKDSENLFTAPQAQEFYFILNGVAFCRDQRQLTTALATDCLGYSAMDLHRLLTDDRAWDDIMARFQSYHDLWQERGFMAMFRSLLGGEEIRTRLLAKQGGERDLTNILHLGELLHKQAQKNPAMSALLDFYRLHLQGDKRDNEFEQRLESDSERLQILTIHKSKGLEFPIVFCPFLWKGQSSKQNNVVFHSGDNKQLTLDLGSNDLDEHKLLARFEENAENVRLAYVALTRATNRCVLNWGGYGSFATSALGYVFHGSGDFTAVQNHLKKCSDDELLQLVQGVVDRSGGTITVRENPVVIAPYSVGNTAPRQILSHAHFSREIERSFQITSFSKMSSGQHHESLIVDRDQSDRADGGGGPAGLSLFDFPRGANPGTFLHYLFEFLDFTDLGSEPSKLFIKGALNRFGYDEKWQPVMEAMLDDVCAVQLPDQSFCLADVAADQRLNELEFHLPLAKGDSGDCAEVFRKHSAVGGNVWYAMLESYGFKLLKGFLKGFVDLVFKQGEQYFIIDWKSNYLGNHHGAYDRVAMEGSMMQSGYILQYHLYSLALHRYLGTRLDDYDYDRHFGGVCYVYLRGVSKKDNHTGLFWDRPSFEFMLDFDRLFGATELVGG